MAAAIPEAAEALPGLVEDLGPGLAKGGEAAGKEGGSASKGLDPASQGQSAAGEASQGMDLISQITSFVQAQEALAVKAAQDQSNDFNIKSAFMDNTLAGVEQIVGGKYNALIVANSQQDNVNLNGILEPNQYDPATVAISNSATVSYRLWVFVDGSYTKNSGFGGDNWAWCGNATRADKKVKHGLNTDPVSTLTFTKRS